MPKSTNATVPEGFRPIFGIPYANILFEGGRSVSVCPRCGKHIAMTGPRKDFETPSGDAYAKHYFAEHAWADGMVKVGQEWYSRA